MPETVAKVFYLLKIIHAGQICIMLASISLSLPANAGDFRIRPSLTLSGEYNDNILLDDEDTFEEYITRIVPAIGLKYRAPRVIFDADYNLEYRYYAKYDTYPGGKRDESVHGWNAEGKLEIMKDLLFLKASDVNERASLDATRNFTQDSPILNQSDRNTLKVNPYFVLSSLEPLTLTAGYRFEKIDYKDPASIDRTRDIVLTAIEYELSPKSKVGAVYVYTEEESDLRTYTRNDAYATARYEFAKESRMFAKLGKSFLDFKEGERYSVLYWNGEISYLLDLWSLTAKSGRDYSDDPTGNPLRHDSYLFEIETERERANMSGLLFVHDYWDTAIRQMDTRRYGIDWHIGYELTSRTMTTLDFTIERYEQKLLDTYSRRYFTGVRIDYAISDHTYLSVIYRYVDSESPGIDENNYVSNRVFIALRSNFYEAGSSISGEDRSGKSLR